MSVAPNQSVGVWIGRPRDPLAGNATAATILTRPNVANQNIFTRVALDAPCDEADSVFDSTTAAPWIGSCSGIDPYQWMPLPAPTLLPDGTTLRVQGSRTGRAACIRVIPTVTR